MRTPNKSFLQSSLLAGLATFAFAIHSVVPAAAATPVAPVTPPDVTTSVVATLTAEEQEGLLFMREEEKLAHDVYVALYAKWGVAAFRNISTAESRHQSAVLTLLERYGIADPAATPAEGEFSIPELQALYDEFVAQGSQSLEGALAVGATIEEVDIQDLDERTAPAIAADVRLVYTHLRDGSANHLRAFAQLIERESDGAWEPQYLDAETYEAIAQAGNTRGNRTAGNASARRGNNRP